MEFIQLLINTAGKIISELFNKLYLMKAIAATSEMNCFAVYINILQMRKRIENSLFSISYNNTEYLEMYFSRSVNVD